ncbi:MAG TPA: aminoglycoside phosphotransferase family protein [Planctomycetes bacterium]|nr:aminoglycoside phosphotransferase family protein [Planctomycetota bacterium]HIN79790.1 aminoglycoside phosphotransferase family protein [Planctomycetota bacterium]
MIGSGNQHQLEPEERGLLQRALERWEFTPQHRADRGGSCRVWYGTCGGDRPAFLKWHPQRRGWSQEERALGRWLPEVPESLAGRPQLIAAHPGDRLLLLSALGGEAVDTIDLTEEKRCAIHRQAGAVLAVLHRLDIADEDPIPLSRALPERLAGWLARSEGGISASLVDTARQAVGDGSIFGDDARVPCHNDFQERNWLWDGEIFSVIDFEHSHLNHPAFDLVRLQFGCWQDAPRLRCSFLEGYGENPPWLTDGGLDAVGAIFAVGSIVWGKENAQDPLVAQGFEILTRLGRRL